MPSTVIAVTATTQATTSKTAPTVRHARARAQAFPRRTQEWHR